MTECVQKDERMSDKEGERMTEGDESHRMRGSEWGESVGDVMTKEGER